MKRIKELVEILNNASNKYYNYGTSELTDSTFDSLMEELKSLEKYHNIVYPNSPTQNVGSPVLDNLSKIDISDKPMLSLDKCHTAKEVMDFANNRQIVGSVKCDGLSVRITYKNGTIYSSNTRGNGEIGQDITEHIKNFSNVPIKIPFKGKLVVDGEAVILLNDFNDINSNGEFKNPRNLAAGTLSSLNTSLCKERRMSFICWDVIEMKNNDSQSYSDRLKLIESYGFTIVPFVNLIYINEKDINIVNDLIKSQAEKLGIPMDGVVYKLDDINADTTRTAKFFNNAIAFKFKDEEVETVLKDISYDISRNGVLTPVAVFEPIEIEGSVCERASLHNLSIMEQTLSTPYINQPIKVVKRNMIIPQINWADKNIDKDKIIPLPDICFSCGKALSIKESDDGVKTLQCTNELCTCRFINKLVHFCSKKGLDIKGLSRATLEKLENNGWLNNISDLFVLKNHANEWKLMPGFGDKSVLNILDAIEESRNTTLEKFITSLGISKVGTTIAKVISKKCEGKWEKFIELIKNPDFSFASWEGLGYEINKSLKTFDYTEANNLIENYIKLVIENTENTSEALKGKNLVITGKLSRKRDDIKADIEKCGGKVVGSVSSKTSYLVCNSPENTTKYRKAEELNIPIITEQELMKLLKF